MSNRELPPDVIERGGLSTVTGDPVHQLIHGRAVPLGAGTEVRRLLPSLGRRMVGAWCFFDHYGPDDIARSDGMQVAAHPHTGLQTVSWLVDGEVHHRDSLGHDVTITPGDLGLMTAGLGIAHSEQSPVPHPRLLHGTQLWVALPESVRNQAPSFEFHAGRPSAPLTGAHVRVVLGDFEGLHAPGTVHSPIVGLDVTVEAGCLLPLESDFEYAAASLDGDLIVDGEHLPVGSLMYLGAGRNSLRIEGSGRLMVLGGEPFAEKLVMWWNFVGRSHEEIVDFRSDWEERKGRFANVLEWSATGILAPRLDAARLRARGATGS